MEASDRNRQPKIRLRIVLCSGPDKTSHIPKLTQSLSFAHAATPVADDDAGWETGPGAILPAGLPPAYGLTTDSRQVHAYSPGVKANVVFFQKGRPTENVWIFDARSNVPGITKKDRPLGSSTLRRV